MSEPDAWERSFFAGNDAGRWRHLRAEHEGSPRSSGEPNAGHGIHVVPLGRRMFRVEVPAGNERPARSTVAYAVRDAASVWVFVDGEVVTVEPQASGRNARRPALRDETLAAPMPAMVVRILVKPGDRASKGMPLVILEAMKMELPLRAPRDAAVRRVMCREGDLVQPGRPLVELEP